MTRQLLTYFSFFQPFHSLTDWKFTKRYDNINKWLQTFNEAKAHAPWTCFYITSNDNVAFSVNIADDVYSFCEKLSIKAFER